MADVTFFLDISYHGSPVFSHVFLYEGGSAVVPFSPDCYVDSGQCLIRASGLVEEGRRGTHRGPRRVVCFQGGQGVSL